MNDLNVFKTRNNIYYRQQATDMSDTEQDTNLRLPFMDPAQNANPENADSSRAAPAISGNATISDNIATSRIQNNHADNILNINPRSPQSPTSTVGFENADMNNNNRTPAATATNPFDLNAGMPNNVLNSNTLLPVMPNFPITNIKLNIPPFSKYNAERWFKLFELQLKNFNVTDDRFKFNLLLAKLSDESAEFAMDIAETGNNVTPYLNTKMHLLNTFKQNSDVTWSEIENMTIGDKRPTIFLHDIFAKNSIAKMPLTRIRSTFIKAMPFHIRNVLRSKSELNINDLARLADELIIYEAEDNRHSNNPVYSLNSSVNSKSVNQSNLDKTLNTFAQTLSKLESRLDQLQTTSHNSNKHTNDKINDNTSNTLCWYHEKFGKKAKKCSSNLCPMNSDIDTLN